MFGFSAPMESSMSVRRDSEIVPLNELPHYENLTGEPYETYWTINPLRKETIDRL